jgi:hypothetical protein
MGWGWRSIPIPRHRGEGCAGTEITIRPNPSRLLISGTSMGNSQLSNPDQLVGTFFILAANG